MSRLFEQFFETFKKLGLEYYQRYYSVYPGVVVDNNDPEKRGRVKITAPSLVGPGKDKVLAHWAVPAYQDMASENKGSFFPPDIDDVVDIFFDHGDINFPRYRGGYWAKGELPDVFKNGYPKVKGFVFSSGQQIIIDETSGKEKIFILNKDGTVLTMDGKTGNEIFQILHKTGSKILLNKDGDITLSDNHKNIIDMKSGSIDVTASGNCSVKCEGNVNVEANGTATVKSAGKATVEGATVDIKSPANSITGQVVTDNLINQDPITGKPLIGVGGVNAI